MSTRESILAAVLKNQPPASPLPDITGFKGKEENLVATYRDVCTSGGSTVFFVKNTEAIVDLIRKHFDHTKRIVTTLPELSDSFELLSAAATPQTFDDIELAVIEAELAVAENGAVWLPEQRMGQRIIPYICQHLAVVVATENIFPTLHEAYQQIGVGNYGFGAFIGGPSKTADIEQALVLGAHGPITMTVFITTEKADASGA